MLNLIFGFLFVITAIVSIHELGHYIAARMCGVSVEVFSVGMGRPLISYKDSVGTLWQIAAMPIGGYVKMLHDGDISSSSPKVNTEISQEQKRRSYIFQPPIKRLFIAISGPLANYILAFAIFFVMHLSLGKMIASSKVAQVVQDSPAFEAGIMQGDIISFIDGKKIERFEQIHSYVSLRPAKRMNLGITRGNEFIHITLVTGTKDLLDEEGKLVAKIGVMGIMSESPQFHSVGIIGSAYEAIVDINNIVQMTMTGLIQMITGDRSLNELRGSISIATQSEKSLQQGYLSFAIYVAIISINIGFVNLLPIPVLDGGHIMLCIYEMMAGGPLNAFAEKILIKVGVVFLIFMFVISTWNDIRALL